MRPCQTWKSRSKLWPTVKASRGTWYFEEFLQVCSHPSLCVQRSCCYCKSSENWDFDYSFSSWRRGRNVIWLTCRGFKNKRQLFSPSPLHNLCVNVSVCMHTVFRIISWSGSLHSDVFSHFETVSHSVTQWLGEQPIQTDYCSVQLCVWASFMYRTDRRKEYGCNDNHLAGNASEKVFATRECFPVTNILLQ